MRRVFSKSDFRTLSFGLALVVLAISLPVAAGVVIRSGHCQPELTMNICQPLQTFNPTLNKLLVPPAPSDPQFVLLDLGSSMEALPMHPDDHRAAPETPPPKFV